MLHRRNRASMNIILVNQCFYPDLIATAQYLTEVAVALAERGHRVRVVTSRHGYDKPEMVFPSHEVWKDIEIHRVRDLALGKSSGWRRALTFLSFQMSCAWQLLIMRRADLILSLTSPPLLPFLASLIARAKRSKLIIWIMDLNPDEAIAHGLMAETSFAAKTLDAFSRFSMHTAQKVILLDKFMQQRVTAKNIPESKLEIVPPWSQDENVDFDEAGRQAFRTKHGLNDKFVVMHSGNHSPCHPMNTVLEAARELATNDNIRFLFVGGGSEFGKIAEFARSHGLSNIVSLPYQPWEELSGSLSAADMHVVLLGDQFLGIKHPCKIYNVLKLGTPILYIGPPSSHITELVAAPPAEELTYSVRNGDVARAKQSVLKELARRREQRVSALDHAHSKKALLSRLLSVLEMS